jgi:uncharacterized protein YndB with AHSA1/START domain
MNTTEEIAARTMVLTRDIAAPRAVVWQALTDPKALPQWWGPAGFTCRTKRIDLRTGGDWVFDMIGPDGTVFPNHHSDLVHTPPESVAYVLRAGENGPEHATAVIRLDEISAGTRVTLRMTLATQEQYDAAMGYEAPARGLETLAKLADHIGAAVLA